MIKNDPTDVLLSAADIAGCWEYHNDVMEKLKNRPVNYTGLYHKTRFFDGRCGEVAFRYWLESNGLWYEETVNSDGYPDQQDYIVSLARKKQTINVKNSNNPHARYLLMPCLQAEKHKQNFYVGCSGRKRGEELVVSLWGIVGRQKFMNKSDVVDFGVPAHGLLLSRLLPLEQARRYFGKTEPHR